ncbi:3-carboxy-cis,cis-muconate cycloisomerase, partial [Streptomyces sp. PSRA5]
MTSDDHAADDAAGRAADPSDSVLSPDAGLLSPGRAGSAAETATGDAAFLRAMLDAEAGLARAQATVG